MCAAETGLNMKEAIALGPQITFTHFVTTFEDYIGAYSVEYYRTIYLMIIQKVVFIQKKILSCVHFSKC